MLKEVCFIIMRYTESQYHCKEHEYTVSVFLKSFVDNKAFCGVISRQLHYKSNTLSWKMVSLPYASLVTVNQCIHTLLFRVFYGKLSSNTPGLNHLPGGWPPGALSAYHDRMHFHR